MIFLFTLLAGFVGGTILARPGAEMGADPQPPYLFINLFPDDGAIHVVWNEVANVGGYRLTWRPAGSASEQVVDLDPTRQAITIDNLQNGDMYEFQVVALENQVELARSIVAVHSPRVRTERVVFTSWVRLNEYLTTQPQDPPVDFDTLACRGRPIPWDIHAPNCLYMTASHTFYLLRDVGDQFDPPQDFRPPAVIRQLARQAIWRDGDPFDFPEHFPITVTAIMTPITGIVTSFREARGYEIRHHAQFGSRVTWFIPEQTIPGQYAIYHEGHALESGVFEPTGAETVSWLLRRGWQVVAIDMPLHGQNLVDRKPGLQGHDDMVALDDGIRSPIGIFMLPVKAVVDLIMADSEPDDPRLLMIGRSGGGWTTYFYSPLDPRVDLAIPVAGGLPKSLRVAGGANPGDYEQVVPHLGVIMQEDLMRAAGTEGTLFIYNQHDPCCFGFHPEDPRYAPFVQHIESAAAPFNKPIRVYVDLVNRAHSIGLNGYQMIDEFLDTKVPVDLQFTGPTIVAPGDTHAYTVTVGPLTVKTPLTYTWVVDDLVPIHQQSGLSATHDLAWPGVGIKHVELFAANEHGVATAAYTVEVRQPVTGVAILGATLLSVGETYTFTAVVTPTTSGQPLIYLWSIAGEPVFTHTAGISDTVAITWPTPGEIQLGVTVTNHVGSASTFHALQVGQPMTRVVVTGPELVQVGEVYTFTATTLPESSNQPITYVWGIGSQMITRTSGISDTITHVWHERGKTDFHLMVANLYGNATTLYQVEAYVPLVGVEVTGTTGIQIGELYTVTATAVPSVANLPITYTWAIKEQAVLTRTGGISDTITLTWQGEPFVEVIANNSYGEVSGRHWVAGIREIFLPLIRRD